MPSMQHTLASCASALVAAGLCALPAIRRGNEKRVALSSWKPYQTRLPSSNELTAWFGHHSGAICIVCGSVSGNLEMIDFDNWDAGGGEAFEAWREAVEAACPGLIDRLVIETTPSGGQHVIYRCEEHVSGNTQLARKAIELESGEPVVVGRKEYRPRRDACGRWIATVTLIETRGEGGMFLCAPSPGYEVIQGDLCRPPIVTADERDVLLGCAWALDETMTVVDGDVANRICTQGAAKAYLSGTQAEDKRNFSGKQAEGKAHLIGTQGADKAYLSGTQSAVRPGDDYNARGDVREVLLRHGWTLARPGENEHWRRPGKSMGTSATLKDRVLYVFSTNAAPFEAHKGYSPFAVYALLEHHGDFAAAASALAAEGFGSSPSVTAGVDLSAFMTDTPPAAGPLEPCPVPVGELVAAYPALRPPVIHGLLRAGETMNVIASPKTGKALAIDTPILTEHGWSTMGELLPGMRVHAADGTLTTVIAATDVMYGRPCYRVQTKSGATIVADEQHLWSVVSRDTHGIVTTADLAKGHHDRRWKLPIADPLERHHVELPIDPWVLGYWLGNGTTRSGEITVAEPDTRLVQDHLARAGYTHGKIRRKRGAVTFTVLALQAQLRALGVLGRKHIPEPYLLASRKQRQMLLAGLLDSDGHAATRGNGSGEIEFTTTSEQLAADVQFLLRSLGCKVRIRHGRATLEGKDCGARFRLSFVGSRNTSPFTSPRKTGGLPERQAAKRSRVDAVVAVEPTASVPVRCIQVDHPTGTFLAGRDLVVTHNSWLTLDLAIAVATGRPWLGRYQTEAGSVLIIDNELHRETSAHRLPKVAQARGVAMQQIADRIFVDNLRGRLLDIFSLAPYFDAIEPGRFKVIVLDAFYRFMPVGGDENDNGTMANIYNRIDAFADRLGCCFVLIHHSTKGSQSSKSVTDVGAGAGAQSRATDTHLVLRPHEEHGVVVLDAAVRSWPPIDPTCLRWDFPVWSVDDTLDPAALKNERPVKRKEPKADEPPKEPEWTVEKFVGAFIDRPQTRDAIVNMAREEGLSIREAKRLITLALSDGLVEQEPFDGRSAPRLLPVADPINGGGD